MLLENTQTQVSMLKKSINKTADYLSIIQFQKCTTRQLLSHAFGTKRKVFNGVYEAINTENDNKFVKYISEAKNHMSF